MTNRGLDHLSSKPSRRRLDPAFRDALRAELVHTVSTAETGQPQRRWVQRWTRRRTLTLTAVLALGVAGGGAAVASGVLPLPGADQVVLRGPVDTTVHTGTATIALGPRPAGVTSVELTLTCLSTGALTFDDGAALTCSLQDIPGENAATQAAFPTPGLALPRTGSAGYTLALQQGQTSTTITATPGTRWSLSTAYSTRTPTDWARNANGQTYGVPKDDGREPDLIAVATTTRTGEQGYVRNTDLNPPLHFTSPQEAAEWSATHPPVRTLPVYAFDGVTIIGEFQTG